MKQYLDLLKKVLDEGTTQNNRTGIDTLRIEGAMLEFNMVDGFPAVTTKKLAFKSVVGELIGFIRGYDNAQSFRNLGCKIWDQNANENQEWVKSPWRRYPDDLGRIYGVQWRGWQTVDRRSLDQLRLAVTKIMVQPDDRRNIVSAWNPGELHMMALPPCHIMHQYIVNKGTNELSMCMYQRSCDMFLGVPFNIASYALLLSLVAMATGRKPGKLIMFLADVHIYTNHVDQVIEQLNRDPYGLPTLKIPTPEELGYEEFDYLTHINPSDIALVDYHHHPAIQAPMAV